MAVARRALGGTGGSKTLMLVGASEGDDLRPEATFQTAGPLLLRNPVLCDLVTTWEGRAWVQRPAARNRIATAPPMCTGVLVAASLAGALGSLPGRFPPSSRRSVNVKRGYYPESYSLRLPEGSLEKIAEAAREAGMSPAEWLRRAIRRDLDAAKKSSRRP